MMNQLMKCIVDAEDAYFYLVEGLNYSGAHKPTGQRTMAHVNREKIIDWLQKYAANGSKEVLETWRQNKITVKWLVEKNLSPDEAEPNHHFDIGMAQWNAVKKVIDENKTHLIWSKESWAFRVDRDRSASQL
jgi:hypothetical protein